ncbi:MAG: type II toxin-antitoxin system RelE/ParE family toxin [bacterium]|nr:type II toxin-antitoxin system RelE/ParE family toxin [bacterium]
MAQAESEQPYSLKYDALAYADLASLDPFWQDEVLAAAEQKLCKMPEIFGKPLRQTLSGLRALRVGDYRVVYRIDKRNVYIIAIIHRSVGYGGIERRLH